LVKANTGRSMMFERGGGGGCEACVALARGQVKLTGCYAKSCCYELQQSVSLDCQSPRGKRHSHSFLRRLSPPSSCPTHFVDGLQLSLALPPWEPDSVSGGAAAAAAVGIGPGPTNVAAGNATCAAPTYAATAAVAAQALTMDSMPLVSSVTVPSNKRSSPVTANGADGGGGGERTSRQSGLAKASRLTRSSY